MVTKRKKLQKIGDKFRFEANMKNLRRVQKRGIVAPRLIRIKESSRERVQPCGKQGHTSADCFEKKETLREDLRLGKTASK